MLKKIASFPAPSTERATDINWMAETGDRKMPFSRPIFNVLKTLFQNVPGLR